MIPIDRANKVGRILSVSRSEAALVVPQEPLSGVTCRYGHGFPFQVAARRAGVFCNIRIDGLPVGDFEAGMDAVVFDDISSIGRQELARITRTERHADAPNGPRIVIKHTPRGGFVPLGALCEGGRPHPGAGTGVLVGEALDFPMTAGGYYNKTDKTRGMIRNVEVNQLAYDGNKIRVTNTQLHHEGEPLRAPGSDWTIVAPGLHAAIPCGEDLLFGAVATQGDSSAFFNEPLSAGVSRWRSDGGAWRMVGFVPVTFDRKAEKPNIIYGQQVHLLPAEPSLIRDLDGSLLYTVRNTGDDAEDHIFRVWRSEDGTNWNLLFEVEQARGQSPVTINQAADGTPYLLSNMLGRERDCLALWPLKEDRSGVEAPMIVRDALKDFGPPPSGLVWFMDHPNAATVQLADGKWHNLLVYRVMDRGEHGGADPAPQTGMYLEEVLSVGSPVASWKFG